MERLLVANRGEVAVRIIRAAAELGVTSVAVFAEDDADSLHVRLADEAVGLAGSGPSAYLDLDAVVAAAVEHRCDALHPGYGFASEDPRLALRCDAAGVVFVGPTAETLAVFGDKGRARELARSVGVPVARGTDGPTDLAAAASFLEGLGPGSGVMVKAIAGGGGRGMARVESLDELGAAFDRCRSEATAAFGQGDVYVEELLPRARHIEVQLVGDGSGLVGHMWDRECSIQRRHQKLVEIAPAPGLPGTARGALLDAAVRLGERAVLRGVATAEFLVDADDPHRFVFLEVNPRLQVEHTVTEEFAGVDLVAAQLKIAEGASLEDLGLVPAPPGRGMALQVRVNLETMLADGSVRPGGGLITLLDAPGGPGVRVDSFVATGFRTNPRYDSLLVKVIVHAPSGALVDVCAKARRALAELRVDGVVTNKDFLDRVLAHPIVNGGRASTMFVADHLAELIDASGPTAPAAGFVDVGPAIYPRTPTGMAGARQVTDDPLAVLHHGKAEPSSPGPAAADPTAHRSHGAVTAPLQGTIVAVAAVGDPIRAGGQLAVMESMKMEHVVAAPHSGVVRAVGVAAGDAVLEGHALLELEPAHVEAESAGGTEQEIDLDHIRPDLAEAIERHAVGMDHRRPEAVARRRRTGHRTARENIAHLCDPGSFIEYAPLVIAAQRRRRELDDLVANTPGDGMVAGIATVNAARFGDETTRCVVMSYDYTVLAGTQGLQNHRKKDRMFELAEQLRLPVVLFAEGGGGRPGDTDGVGVAGLDCMAFRYFGELSGLVPLVGIATGRCFAGNAALLGCCDVVIATADSNIGMGGPAMIEGGGLGVFRPEEVGPMAVQVPNGVVDIAVADENEAVEVAQRYLGYFQGRVTDWSCADQRRLRHTIPENRLRIYDVRAVIATMFDDDSVLELRRRFGVGMVTALARIEGRAVGVVANNPTHLAGAIDSDGADKAARFLQLCDAFDLPVVFLCDTPGIMVGPEAETTALVRHASRLFVTGASIDVPVCTIVLRKGYGLGAQAMAAGSFKAPIFTVAWPTGEFGGMGLEGAVKLGYRNELAAIEDPDERRATYAEMVDRMYERGKAVSMSSHFEIDDVIDPAQTRHWITSAFAAAGPPPSRSSPKRPCIDTW